MSGRAEGQGWGQGSYVSIHWPIIKRLVGSPKREALVDDRRTYRAAEVLVGAMHVAGVLRARCGTPTVGIMLPTSGAFPITALAAWMLGKTVVPLNYLLKKEELQYVVDDCGTDTVVTSRQMVEHIPAPDAKNLLFLEDIDFKAVPEPIWPASADDGDLGVLLYTSGTSGRPKGVMLSHGNISANLDQIMEWVTISPREDVILGVLPQFHTFGLTVLTLLPLVANVKAVYTARFVPQKIVRLMRQQRPTIFVAIPSMYNALLSVKDAKPEDFASLRLVVSGGEPLPDAVFQKFRERFGVTLNEGYGLTETAPVTNWCRPEEWRPHSVGRALPRVEERIADINDGRLLDIGQEGEIQIKGPNVMQGYYHLPEESAKAFTPDNWFRTGDIGRFDDDGHLYITGRLKEMLIIGGENVFPREIEEVISTHAAVGGVGVIGMPDPMRGEVPIAFVEAREGMTVEGQELIRLCREKLAGYKVPAEVRVVEALPRNPTGKVVRRELKKLV
jgi:long-chain acyl-CoA synthetase